jgi:hypothetical protein
MMGRRLLRWPALGALVGSLGLVASAHAKVPGTLTHQGRLYSSAMGNPPVSGSLSVTFAIYDAATGGTMLWTETHQITFDNGYFSAELGSTTAFPATVFDGSTRYLGITVGTDPEMSPRATVGSVPYAFLANDVNGDIHPTSVSVGGTTVIDMNGHWVGQPMGATGATGPQGPIGPAGPVGPAGATGATGSTGAVGPQGPAGATGAAGPQGPAGAQGPTGATGVAGPPGPAGATGATGAAGPQGPTGAQGPAGAVGPQGPPGATGAVGPQGPAGAAGAQGPAGAVGPQGPPGAAGAVGPQGPAGAAGAQGPAGAVGPQGPPGATGAVGPQGPVGPAGPAGPTGATGPVNVPTCPGSQVLTGAGGALTCVSRPALGIYVGNSTVSTNGAISHAGQPTGLLSAAAYCADTYGAGAHMCTGQEIYNSVLAGVFAVGTAVPKGWMYFPSSVEPDGPVQAGNNPQQGQADNCAGYTYPTSHRLWAGIAFEWNANAGGAWSPFYDVTGCFTALPIACCQ